MFPRTLIGALFATLAIQAMAQGVKPTAAASGVQQPSLMFSSQAVRYRCDGDAEIELAYLNLSNGTTFAALHHGGRTVMMQGRKATTGVRFFALDDKVHLSWYTQGMKGELKALASDPAMQDQILMSNCFAQPAQR